MAKSLIDKDDLEGALRLRQVRSMAGEPIELHRALYLWKRMDGERREHINEAHAALQPQVVSDYVKARNKFEAPKDMTWHFELRLERQ